MINKIKEKVPEFGIFLNFFNLPACHVYDGGHNQDSEIEIYWKFCSDTRIKDGEEVQAGIDAEMKIFLVAATVKLRESARKTKRPHPRGVSRVTLRFRTQCQYIHEWTSHHSERQLDRQSIRRTDPLLSRQERKGQKGEEKMARVREWKRGIAQGLASIMNYSRWLRTKRNLVQSIRFFVPPYYVFTAL